MDLEQALLNTVIAFKLMQYSYSLKSFFKDQFKTKNGYKIPYSHVIYFKRHVFRLLEMHVIMYVQTTIINVPDTV